MHIKSSKPRPPSDLQTPVLNDGQDVLEPAPSVHTPQHKSKYAWLFFSTSGRLGRLNYFLSFVAIYVVAMALIYVSHTIFFLNVFDGQVRIGFIGDVGPLPFALSLTPQLIGSAEVGP
jgi:hypothetical protein